MAVVYQRPGEEVGFRPGLRSEDDYAVPQGASSVRFDGRTNQALLNDLRHNHRRYSVVSGQLFKDGNPVTPNPPGPLYQAVSQMDADIAALNSPLTLVEIQRIVQRGLRVLRYLVLKDREV